MRAASTPSWFDKLTTKATANMASAEDFVVSLSNHAVRARQTRKQTYPRPQHPVLSCTPPRCGRMSRRTARGGTGRWAVGPAGPVRQSGCGELSCATVRHTLPWGRRSPMHGTAPASAKLGRPGRMVKNSRCEAGLRSLYLADYGSDTSPASPSAPKEAPSGDPVRASCPRGSSAYDV